MLESEMRFGFGKNWADFIDAHLSEARIANAQGHLLRFLGLPDLKGRTFLDIGCGSGLHSLAALRAGAERITSFDFDVNSVQTTEKLRTFAGAPSHWTVRQGSVLDREFMSSLAPADIVYSWGVLHHTGSMWQAIRNAANPMKPDAVFYIALYTSDVYIDPTPEYWLATKRRYNNAGALQQRLMEWHYAWKATILPDLRHGRNPWKTMREHFRNRGMSYWIDVRDWLGGYPMEFAGIAETKSFARDELGMELLNISAGEANTEYLFRPTGTSNYWDEVQAQRSLEVLESPFAAVGGHAFTAELPHYGQHADDMDDPRRSHLMLYEDRIPIGFAHQTHADVKSHGAGRYSHWRQQLMFSTTDNTDPNTNGRQYHICLNGLP
jgi:cyclopropane fatty-acyl-phospholipid synthase-like methyltransferase